MLKRESTARSRSNGFKSALQNLHKPLLCLPPLFYKPSRRFPRSSHSTLFYSSRVRKVIFITSIAKVIAFYWIRFNHLLLIDRIVRSCISASEFVRSVHFNLMFWIYFCSQYFRNVLLLRDNNFATSIIIVVFSDLYVLNYQLFSDLIKRCRNLEFQMLIFCSYGDRMAVVFTNLGSQSGLQKLNEYLLTRSYISG